MADYAFTGTKVKPLRLEDCVRAIAGESINAGDMIDEDPTTGRMILADADLSYADTSRNGRCRGIAVSISAAGQPVFYVPAGRRVIVHDTPDVIAVSFSPVYLAETAGKTRGMQDVIDNGGVATLVGMFNADSTQIQLHCIQAEGQYGD